MTDVRAYHPGTEAEAMVPEEAMFHLRQSGWLLRDEHDANQAAAAEAAQASVKKTASEEK